MLESERLSIGAYVDDVSEAIGRAESEYSDYEMRIDEIGKDNAEWWLEIAYYKLLVVGERLGLSGFTARVAADLDQSRREATGLMTTAADPFGDTYLTAVPRLRQFVMALETLRGPQLGLVFTKDVIQILRGCEYVITDPTLFPTAPRNEADVHARVEGVLRCVFPDLLRKPRLAKPIKHFEPDTGLPSQRTLIEYKFISDANGAKAVADEILADWMGYTSRDYDHIIYVIYETVRIRPESEWQQLLMACGAGPNATAIVISGVQPDKTRPQRRRSRVP